MKRMAIAVLAGTWLSGVIAADAPVPRPVLPEKMAWVSQPTNPDLQLAWIIGEEKKPGPYVLRVKLAAGGRIQPHAHPDERNSTVLSGTLYVGFGKTFDTAQMVAVPVGGVYVTPANMPHFIWAKDGEVLYQEVGVAPTGTLAVK